ncbi:MAG: mycothiol conjugate amidase Mca [Acidimicrobiia bacterium]
MEETRQSADRLCLLSVHAHPDDEASKGAGTVVRYAGESVHTVLVTCTGGEAGEILNPAVDTPEIQADLAAVRMAELEESVRILRYSKLHLLGYRDSGMPDSEDNARPESFAAAPLEEAVGRLVALIRAERPQVILTYDDDHTGYPHPDHIRVHDISVAAFEAAGDPDRFPEAGPPFQPLKLYYSVWSRARVEALHQAFVERGEESPYQRWMERWNPDDVERPITTRIDVSDFLNERRAALLAHRTQIDPESFWMRLPEDVVREVFPWEEYRLARSLVDAAVPEDGFEEDLFAGVRLPAARE